MGNILGSQTTFMLNNKKKKLKYLFYPFLVNDCVKHEVN